jgi:alkylated DNA repair dioxygenase AlkB
VGIPITYVPNFVANPDEVYGLVQAALDMQNYGAPRTEFYTQRNGLPYTYGRGEGRRTYESKPEPEVIRVLRERLEEHCGVPFDAMFANGYADGKDHLGWHSDDSPEMDDNRPIGIISFGVEREIWFRQKPANNGKCVACNGSGRYDSHGSPACSSCGGTGKENAPAVTTLKLGHGSLCLMAPGMQDAYQHRIPKAGFVCGPRISLTFRGSVVT